MQGQIPGFLGHGSKILADKYKLMIHLEESPLNRNDRKSEQYSLDLLKRIIPNFQSVWRHRSELGFVPVKGTLPYTLLLKI
jgi:hypothetical protein